MFGWFFLQFMDFSCTLMPLLIPYLSGVAITCMGTFLMGFLHIVMSDTDSTVSYGSDYQDVLKPNPVLVRQKTIDKFFMNICVFLLVLHLFWFLFGSINILPVVFIEGLYLSTDMLRTRDCEATVHFWFSFLCLCLQWFLFMVVAIWYKVETSFRSEEFKSNRSAEAKDTQDHQQECWQYHSFPRPSLG